MRVLISGASGLVGSALVPALLRAGHRCVRLVRRPVRTCGDEVRWDPARGQIDAAALSDLDAVIHLAGENVGKGRWTSRRKARIRNSRVLGTKLLCEALMRQERPPSTALFASAIGYYGDRGQTLLTEEDTPGYGFLADTCVDWEAAATPLSAAGVRTVFLRIGVVLSPAGGALKKLLPTFRLGLGGRFGPGKQWWSWVALEDVVGLLLFALDRADLQGPINAVAPEPAMNAEFARVLGRVLRRPALVPMPSFALRALLGEMADALLLSSTRVAPARALQAGYRFAHPSLEDALRDVL